MNKGGPIATPAEKGSLGASTASAAIRFRWLTIALSLVVGLAFGLGAGRLEFENNYRAWFSPENPELRAFETFQNAYAKSDSFLFVIERRDGGDIFTAEALNAVAELTDAAWRIPYSRRVDSLTNFQHTYAVGDDLIVEDLVADPDALSPADLEARRGVALAEPLLRDLLISGDARATAVLVTLQYPEQSISEVPAAATAARALRDRIEETYPALDLHLTGGSMLNMAFAEASQMDLTTLVPLMLVIILAALAATIGSVTATAATVSVIILSTVVAMGAAGYIGIDLTGVSVSSPVIILTLAIADSVHILISMRQAQAQGAEKRAAIVEAIRINFTPVAVTSITTMIGFLALLSADSPPFRDLGLIAAIGIFAAWVYSVTLLPALLSFASFRPIRARADGAKSAMTRFADFVIAHPRMLLLISATAIGALIVQIPRLELSDKWREYFSPRIEYRVESDKALPHFGFAPIEYSVPAGEAGGVADPAYLKKVDAFAEWLRQQDDVRHVYSVTDLLKRLNRNMNGDDPAAYQLPDTRELSAQYLLLYELSLPYGLDLNDRITLDKSATRVTATLDGRVTSKRTREFLAEVDDWFAANAPDLRAEPTSPEVMFTYIARRNVDSMIRGLTIAVIAVALIMVIALRSFSMGLLSLIPNGLPILGAFGAWALLVGEVSMAVSGVAPIALGIVIDDTVHFLTKFMRARRERSLDAAASIRYAFETVGVALFANTVIISTGIMVMALSAYIVNVHFGVLTALTIVIAFLLDFFLLPSLLLLAPTGRRRVAATQSA